MGATSIKAGILIKRKVMSLDYDQGGLLAPNIYGGLNFILRCNYDKKFLDQIGLPQFYKLIVLYFLELKESFPNQSGQEQILLYRHQCFTGKNTTRKIHTKPHSGLEWRIFNILTSEDIDAFGDIKFFT